MDIILQMKINLAHINETLIQQTYEIREQLGLVFEEEKGTLEHCLTTIDEKLKQCSTLISDYQRRHAELAAMREKLVQLGAEPSALPPLLPSETVENIIAWRLRGLRDEGRF
jgi:predicted nuclease with TOPRIM domain